MAHRSSSPNASSPSVSSLRLSSRTVAIAGATATLATAGAVQALKPVPSYEGSIQLVGILPENMPTLHSSSHQLGALSPTLASANIAPPDLIQSVQSDVLQDSAMAATVSARLKKNGIMMTPSRLIDQLQTRTSPQGWLELHYQATDPQQVELVLEQVAQWYASQNSNCDIQACRDVPFIEAQMPILKQQQQQLEQELVALKTKLNQTVSAHMGETMKTLSIEEYSAHLLTQQHHQVRHIAHLEKKIAETLTQLQTYQGHMNLSTVKVQTGFALLRRILPHYQEWLTTWQTSDRQLLAFTLNQTVSQTRNQTVSQTRQQEPQVQQTALPSNAEFPTPLAIGSTALAQQQQALQTQMSRAVSGITRQSIMDMPQPVRELILADVSRFEHMGNWLETLHRLQLLDLRRQTLKQIQQDTVAQAQEWQQTMAVQEQLQQELATTKESLDKYQQRYAIAQRQMAKEALEWKVMSPPEIGQEPGGLSWLFSRLHQTPNPLMTLRLP